MARETIEEIVHMIHEFNIPSTSRLAGIDAGFFFTMFGEKWTRMLVNKLKALSAFAFYAYGDEQLDDAAYQFLHTLAVPVFAPMTPSRSAALISRSDFIVSGKTVFFELANLLQKPVIGLFEKNEIDRYCRQSPSTSGIAFDASPDETTADHIVHILKLVDGQKTP